MTFFAFKQGFHSDEVWSYGFSNSYFRKELVYNDNGESILNQWNDSELLLNYISVEKDNRFSFVSVYDNLSKDLNPPFYNFILNFISSFFAGKFSRWFAFSINLISFIGIQLFIYLIIKCITCDDIVGVGGVILYGLSVGCMDTILFLRMYALGTFFACVFFYLSLLIYKKQVSIKECFILYLFLFISCFLGAYTLNLFLVFAFPVALLFVISYIFTKKIKVFFEYGLSCLLPVILAIVLFPTTVGSVGGGNETHSYSFVKYPTKMQIRLYFYDLTRDLFGIHVSPYSNVYFKYLLIVLGICLFFSVPLFFVFRNEKWLKKICNYLKDNFDKLNILKNYFPLIPMIVTVVFTVIIDSYRTSLYLMTVYANRYLFLIYPFMSMFICIVCYISLKLIFKKGEVVLSVLIAICLFLSVFSHFFENSDVYFFKHNEEGISLKNMDNDSRCIIVLMDDWVMTAFAPELYHIDSFYCTNVLNYRDDYIFDFVDKDQPMYIAVEQSFILDDSIPYEEVTNNELISSWIDFVYHEEDFLKFYKDFEFVEDVIYVGADTVSCRDYKIYKVLFK